MVGTALCRALFLRQVLQERDLLVHVDEPLGRIAEDHRLLRAPGMRILMLEATPRDHHAGRRQRLDHRFVCLALLTLVGDDALARKARRIGGERAVLVDGVGDCRVDAPCAHLLRRLHRRPDVKVLAAMPRSGVHEARARIVSDVVTIQQRYVELVAAEASVAQGVLADHHKEVLASNRAQTFEFLHLACLHHAVSELVGEDVFLAHFGPIVLRRCSDLVEAVADLVMIADGSVAGDRPRRCRPDDDMRTW